MSIKDLPTLINKELVQGSIIRRYNDKELVHLAKHDPGRLLNLIETEMDPTELTFALEALGLAESSPRVLYVLMKHLEHESALVREGALYGINDHLNAINVMISNMGQNDPSPAIRRVATDIYLNNP